MPDPLDFNLPDWVVDALRAPVAQPPKSPHRARSRMRTRIMNVVRVLPAPRRLSARMAPSRWARRNRRGWLSPIGGLMTTMAVGVLMLLRLAPAEGALAGALRDTLSDTLVGIQATTHVLGDSVVPVTENSATSGTSSAHRLLDTLRIVEFVVRGTSVHAASVLGDFNAWQRSATPLASVGHHEWRARILVPRDALRLTANVAYLVNNDLLVPDAPTQ